jgi:hypothetical protein
MPHRHPGLRELALIGVQQQPEVVEEGLVAAGVTLQRIGQVALRQALPAPVVRQDDEPALEEIGDGLVVFLDRLGAPARQDDGAARRAAGRRRRL